MCACRKGSAATVPAARREWFETSWVGFPRRSGPKRLCPAVVLFSHAEERYLLGANHFLRDAGRAGPLYNFEASPGSRALHDRRGHVGKQD
jgi:hypothetical protein